MNEDTDQDQYRWVRHPHSAALTASLEKVTSEQASQRSGELHELRRYLKRVGVLALVTEEHSLKLGAMPCEAIQHDPYLVVYRANGDYVIATSDGVSYTCGSKSLSIDDIESMAAWLSLLARI